MSIHVTEAATYPSSDDPRDTSSKVYSGVPFSSIRQSHPRAYHIITDENRTRVPINDKPMYPTMSAVPDVYDCMVEVEGHNKAEAVTDFERKHYENWLRQYGCVDDSPVPLSEEELQFRGHRRSAGGRYWLRAPGSGFLLNEEKALGGVNSVRPTPYDPAKYTKTQS